MVSVRGGGDIVRGEGGNWSWGGEGKGGVSLSSLFCVWPPLPWSDICGWHVLLAKFPIISFLPFSYIQNGGGGVLSSSLCGSWRESLQTPKHSPKKTEDNFFDWFFKQKGKSSVNCVSCFTICIKNWKRSFGLFFLVESAQAIGLATVIKSKATIKPLLWKVTMEQSDTTRTNSNCQTPKKTCRKLLQLLFVAQKEKNNTAQWQ